jgi:penicillin-binding protein 2
VPLVRQKVPLPASPDAVPRTETQWRVDWSPSLIFSELDDRTLVHFFTQVPRRGSILDRNGEELAVDARVPVIGIVPDLIRNSESTIAALTEALELPEGEVRAQVEAELPSYYFIPVQTLPYGTTEEDVQEFFGMADLGVVVREETLRVYPQGSMAAHIVGYMAEVTAEQLEEMTNEGFEAGDTLGAFGLELALENVLAGRRGGTLATITPEGTIARTITEKPAAPGKDAWLTIDVSVQRKAEEVLGERVGSIVVMDPRNNWVLALASFPRFDPNAFVEGLTAEEFNELTGDDRQPFLHRPLLATYPPGSTFKVVTMAAGLERGGFTTGSRIHCSPVWTGLGEEFEKKNWQAVDLGFLTPAEGLMASCNPVFYEMAKVLDEVDEDALPEVARQFGFGAPTGIDALDEAPGVAPGPQWKQETIGEPWYRGDAVNMGIGQGDVLATPLQIANMYSAIAGDGVLRQPQLIRGFGEPGVKAIQELESVEINPLPVTVDTLSSIRHGLTLVTQNPGGTSYRVFLGASVDAAGKSGTAEDLASGADHVFFVAYANRSAPSVMALAALDEGKSGSQEAGPMVLGILEEYLAAGAAAGSP